MEFRAPKERDMFSFKDAVGHLVVFRDVGPVGETKTQYDDHSPCVTAKNVYDVTAGKQFADAIVFGKAVIHAIFDEECVVGVVTKGPASAGKSGAWLLDAPTEAQLQEARDYVDAKEGSWGAS